MGYQPILFAAFLLLVLLVSMVGCIISIDMPNICFDGIDYNGGAGQRFELCLRR